MQRRVDVGDGPFAFRMTGYRAACANEVGLEILTLPLLATRLAGGFRRPADRETLATAAARAPEDGGFAHLDVVRGLPGMVRAVLQTLERAWRADIDLDNPAFSFAIVCNTLSVRKQIMLEITGLLGAAFAAKTGCHFVRNGALRLRLCRGAQCSPAPA
jgi:hypothetical protein